MLPVPPAQIQEAPASREVAFPGFNAHPLKGAVLAAQGSPWFAVLVADSGPLDRDWAGPRWPQSHGGRALAQWLRHQGVGSLRFDKRLFGSRDPRLDVSLDAQVGDVKAALGAARALPEAQGRRLLLVGHGEGALLSLLAAGGADALLLLGMPSQSMAQAIAGQVRLQLPPAKAAPNMAYLESTLQAIRKGGPLPSPGADVFPALSRMCKSLMAPETLDFVRSTLDLDPLAMAGRASVPLALAWGEKDLQAAPPAVLPKGFSGTVLRIPQANHLLKREPRPRAELDPASALEAYGDEVPLADLAPMAAWLKELK
jgi:hypothetical protein